MRPLVAGALAFLLALGGTLALLPRPETVEDGARERGAEGVLAALADPEEVRLHGLERPAWRPGHAWRVQFEPSGFACTLVVVPSNGTDHVQAAACEGAEYLAAEDAVFDYAFVGRFDRDLAGIRKEAPLVRFYAWPLVEGKRWATSWFGLELTVEAKFDPALKGPQGAEPGFQLTMRYGEETVASYDYVPSLGWWSRLSLRNGFSMEVKALNASWSGKAVLGSAEPRMGLSGSGIISGTFDATVEDDMLMLVRSAPGTSLQRLHATAPNGRLAYSSMVLPLFSGGGFSMGYLPPEAGTWRVDVAHAGSEQTRVSAHAIDLVRVEV